MKSIAALLLALLACTARGQDGWLTRVNPSLWTYQGTIPYTPVPCWGDERVSLLERSLPPLDSDALPLWFGHFDTTTIASFKIEREWLRGKPDQQSKCLVAGITAMLDADAHVKEEKRRLSP